MNGTLPELPELYGTLLEMPLPTFKLPELPEALRLRLPETAIDEDIPTSLLPPSLIDENEPAVKLKSNEVRIGPITRARMKREQASHEDERSSWTWNWTRQLMDARGRSGRHAREKKKKSRPAQHPVEPAAMPARPVPGLVQPGDTPDSTRRQPDATLMATGWVTAEQFPRPVSTGVGPKDKDGADLMTWRDYEALRNEMRREFRIEDDDLRGTVQEISQKLDATNETVTTMTDQMTDIQRSLQALQLAVENLTNQQQQQDADADEAPGRGARPRGWAPLGHHGRGLDEEDGLGKPKFSIPKFEGGADVEEYLTWELKIEKLWRLHNYTEDRKIKLASFEFDGYALRWWDALVRNRQEDGEPPIITWRAMKEAMNSRFVPTNYLRTIYDKLTLLRQGVKIVDEYYMEMESLIQRGRGRESLEMIMQRFLHGLKYDIKGIVRFQSYTTMNGLLHHAREAEAQLAEEAKVKGRATGAGCFTPRAPPSTAPAPSRRSGPYSTPSSKPVSNVPNTKKSESAASTSGSSMSTARNRDMNCHTCGGKGHFKRDCPNRKVMIVNEDNEYETGDDVDPYAPEDDDYDSDGLDAYPSDARTIVVSQRALNVLPSASTQRCNLFQTKALVGPDKACKVIIDGGSCRNLASKELFTKLKLKYLPHPHPYYIQWLSDNGEMKVNHMVRVEFEIGPYKDSIDFDVVPMTEFRDVFPEEVPAGLPPLRGIEHQIDLILGASLPNRAPYRTTSKRRRRYRSKYKRYSTKYKKGKDNIVVDALSRKNMLLTQLDVKIPGLEILCDLYATDHDFVEPYCLCAIGLMGHFEREKTLLMLADHFYWPKMRRDVDRYEEGASIARGGKKQLDMELDKKTHGRAREEREACAREEEEVQAGPASGRTGRHAGAPGSWSGPTGRHTGFHPAPIGRHADGNRAGYCRAIPAPGQHPACQHPDF
ncbi:hypothetical protein QYE76_022616 [Lolium multiflorum]|uniref:CCHC-type domain-containing protein n=1 Tax=Lolium multiflorum TaxID=4521 RepID=A0AAD8RCX8_LOLMU|nr:hypothetical protein QYE76_022616 [Lolium multiflorum]